MVHNYIVKNQSFYSVEIKLINCADWAIHFKEEEQFHWS